jgi:hypothetical protein
MIIVAGGIGVVVINETVKRSRRGGVTEPRQEKGKTMKPVFFPHHGVLGVGRGALSALLYAAPVRVVVAASGVVNGRVSRSKSGHVAAYLAVGTFNGTSTCTREGSQEKSDEILPGCGRLGLRGSSGPLPA